jgi:hypothetical protein
VREHDALFESGTQDRLVFVDLDLDADRLEPDDVLFTHGYLAENFRGRDAAISEGKGPQESPAATLPDFGMSAGDRSAKRSC